MISVAEARAVALAHVHLVPAVERVALADALHRTLSEAVIAKRAQPPFAASAMDGYALRCADTPGRLRVIGESGAGHPLARALAAGECARIFTGAPVPEGADAVLIQEEADRDGDVVAAPKVEAGRHIRGLGIDFAAGVHLIEPFTALNAAAISLAAAAGCATLNVVRRPMITTLSGGDEIVPLNETPGPAQIFESGSHGIAALAITWGANARAAPPFVDNLRSISTAMEAALSASDLAVIIGGASVGDHDHARAAVQSLGAQIQFQSIALRPGKPTWFAVRGDKAVLGLPGNPTSAMVCARLFLRPMIDKMLGRDPSISTTFRHARLRTSLEANGARETYVRATSEIDANGQVWVTPAGNQDSSLVTVFASADMLILRTPNQAAANAGDIVQMLPI